MFLIFTVDRNTKVQHTLGALFCASASTLDKHFGPQFGTNLGRVLQSSMPAKVFNVCSGLQLVFHISFGGCHQHRLQG